YGSLQGARCQWLFQQALEVPLVHARGNFLEQLHGSLKPESLNVGIAQSSGESVRHPCETVSVETLPQRRECLGKCYVCRKCVLASPIPRNENVHGTVDACFPLGGIQLAAHGRERLREEEEFVWFGFCILKRVYEGNGHSLGVCGRFNGAE